MFCFSIIIVPTTTVGLYQGLGFRKESLGRGCYPYMHSAESKPPWLCFWIVIVFVFCQLITDTANKKIPLVVRLCVVSLRRVNIVDCSFVEDWYCLFVLQ
jgi:hypothetical protein